MLRVAPASAFPLGLGLALAAIVSAATGACQGPDPYYRNADGGLRLDATGSAGSVGASGKAGTSGASGKAGTSGAGAAGTGSGAAGTSAAAAGTGGVITGAAGTAGPCTLCKVNVQYTCRSGSEDTTQASFVLNVTNNSTVTIALSDLTLRYWYSADTGKEQVLDCDFAKLGCTNVSASANQAPAPVPRFEPVTPPRRMPAIEPDAPPVVVANTYAEISFSPGALALDPFLDTGEIQLRLHNKDFSPIVQKDDYSFDGLMKGNPIEGTKITAYVKGVLVWGTEPP